MFYSPHPTCLETLARKTTKYLEQYFLKVDGPQLLRLNDTSNLWYEDHLRDEQFYRRFRSAQQVIEEVEEQDCANRILNQNEDELIRYP